MKLGTTEDNRVDIYFKCDSTPPESGVSGFLHSQNHKKLKAVETPNSTAFFVERMLGDEVSIPINSS